MLIDNVMERFPVSNTIPTPQNCLITDLRARSLSKHPLVTIYSLLTYLV